MESSELQTAPPDHELRGDAKAALPPEHVNDQSVRPLDPVFGGASDDSLNEGTTRLLRSPSLSHSVNGSVRAIAFRRAQQTNGNRFAQRALAERVIQRHCSCGGISEKCSTEDEAFSASPAESTEESDHLIQRQIGASSTSATFESNGHEVIPSGSGEPLEEGTREFMESRFGIDFSDVRVHADARSAQSAEAFSANAYTTGRDIYFAAGRYIPYTKEGQHLLAHELAHTVQQNARDTEHIANESHLGFLGEELPLEREAEKCADAVSAGNSVATIMGRSQAAGVARDSKEKPTKPDEPSNPLADWTLSQNSLLFLLGDKLYVIPGGDLVWLPSSKAQEQFGTAKPHLPTDLGTLFEVPATGASGTRVFQAGPRTALMIDSGADPLGRIPAAVYLGQLQAVMANLGITAVQKLQIIHIHKDHISEAPQVIASYGVRAEDLIIPRAYLNVNREIRQVVNALTNTADPGLLAKGFGVAWLPGTSLRDRGGPGDVFRYTYKVGDLVVENVALRSALRNLAGDPKLADLASYLTKVIRPADQASVVVLGDLRGADLESIRRAMETQRRGSWNEFFSGVTILSGFSHHVGRIEDKDTTGLMAVLDATLLQTGKLRVVEQTNPGMHAAARADTMELLSRLGVELVTAELPTAGATPSAAGATKGDVYSRGPEATTRTVVQSRLTEALSRIVRLNAARETIETWRPFFEEVDPSARDFFNRLMPEIEQSTANLRQAARTSAEGALRVRSGGVNTPAGGRDFSASGGIRGADFESSLQNIPSTTAAESLIKPEGFEALEKYRGMEAEEIPLRVALHAAMTRGEYNDKAFTYMLQSLDPGTRDSLLAGPRGGPSPKLKAFERVRAEFGFRSAVLGTGEFMQVPRNWSATGRVAAQGVAGVLLFVEIWNDLIAPIIGSVQTGKRIFSDKNLLPFVRRLLFWQQAHAFPKLVGVEDPVFSSPTYERNYDKVIRSLNENKWDALFIEQPGLEDVDVFCFGAWLSYYVRNYNEFALLFRDSGQDAVIWSTPSDKGWEQATWSVRVGRYETSGENHVEESWHKHDKLTQLMQVYAHRIIANTQALLGLHASGKSLPQETEARLGSLDLYESPKAKVRLKIGPPNDPGKPTPVMVETIGHRPQWLKRELSWWSPPEFWLYRRTGDYAIVGGADYNTYAVIRSLETEQTNLFMGEGGNFTRSEVVGNHMATVIIHLSRLVADPPYQIPIVAPEGVFKGK